MWITTEELGQYLRSRYPEMKFKEKRLSTYCDDKVNIEFVSDVSKKAGCDFYVSTFSDESWEEWAKSTWKDKTIVYLGYSKHYGNYSGGGWAVDNKTDLESGIATVVKRVKEMLGIKEPQQRQLTIFDLMEGL